MSLLWINAALDGNDYGEPTEDYVRQTKHDYLRQHYDDPEWNPAHIVADQSVHDHIVALPHLGEGAYTQERAHCPGGARDCTHALTDKKMREVAQSNWDISHREVFDPAGHQKANEESQQRAQDFAERLNLGAPGRVHLIDEHGNLSAPDDPRNDAL